MFFLILWKSLGISLALHFRESSEMSSFSWDRILKFELEWYTSLGFIRARTYIWTFSLVSVESTELSLKEVWQGRGFGSVSFVVGILCFFPVLLLVGRCGLNTLGSVELAFDLGQEGK